MRLAFRLVFWLNRRSIKCIFYLLKSSLLMQLVSFANYFPEHTYSSYHYCALAYHNRSSPNPVSNESLPSHNSGIEQTKSNAPESTITSSSSWTISKDAVGFPYRRVNIAVAHVNSARGRCSVAIEFESYKVVNPSTTVKGWTSRDI
jgi:hypothetical protein